jgi:hypothetical protein
LSASASASASAADPVVEAEARLRSANLYVDPGVTGFVKVDQTKVVGSVPDGVKIAVLPASAGSPVQLAGQIGQAIDPVAKVVGVFTADPGHFAFGAGSSAYCNGYANAKAEAALAANRDQMRQTHDITELLRDFAVSVASGPARGSSACGSAQGGGAQGGGGGTTAEKDKGSAVWPWVLGIGVVGAGGMGGLAWYRRRRKKRELDAARTKVMPYYDRLANEVSTIDPKDNDVAQQAMADASERFNTAGAQLGTADSVEKFAQARRTTLEGLYAARTAREAVGLDEGAPLPPVSDARGDQLSEAQEVTVQGQTFQGYPSYTPGAPYYYGGGYGVPGGWYSTPFWETLLLAGVLSGGFGGWGGGGFGYGYDSGYQSGYDAGRDSTDGSSSSGDDGGGSSGDWGGGGGDWGGGGGGDWGGGGDGGGSW